MTPKTAKRLRALAREAVAKSIRWTGVPAALRRTHAGGHVAILLYHDPRPEVLDAHLSHLARRYSFTTLDAVVGAISAGDWSGVPDGALVLTFDDGHKGNFDLLPLFRRYGVRPTIYLCSQIVGTGRRFWFSFRGLETGPYKRLSNHDRLDALRRDFDFDQEREYYDDERVALSSTEIEKMAPWVDFGSHTRFHPVLTQCSDEEAWLEIEASKRELESVLGRPVLHFAYPNGDHLEREVGFARAAGFASARTTDSGWTHVGSDPHRLKIFGISDDASVDMLAAQGSGISGYLRRLSQGSFGGRTPTTPQAPSVAASGG